MADVVVPAVATDEAWDDDAPELECLRGFPDAEVGSAGVLADVGPVEAAVVVVDPDGAADDVVGEFVVGVFSGATVRKN